MSTYISLQLPGIFLLYHPLSPFSFSQMHKDVDRSLGHEQPTKCDPQGRSDCHFLSSSQLPVALQLGMEHCKPLLSHTATFNCIDFVRVTIMVMGSNAQVCNSHVMPGGQHLIAPFPIFQFVDSFYLFFYSTVLRNWLSLEWKTGPFLYELQLCFMLTYAEILLWGSSPSIPASSEQSL